MTVVAIIAYGSLYPFQFHDRPGSPFDALATSVGGADSRGDILANILLYFPLGFFAVQMFRRRTVTLWAGVTLAGTLLSISMELTQYYVPGRLTQFADVCTNTLGTFAGAGAGTLLGGIIALDFLRPLRKHPSTLLLLACWMGYRLFPYAPVIDLHKYWHAVRPLIVSPVLPPVDLVRHTALWLLLALLIDDFCTGDWSRIVFPLSAGLVLAARIAIIDSSLSPAEVLGGMIVVFCWVTFLFRMPGRNVAGLGVFTLAVILASLEPFRFEAPRPFGWVPFYGFLHGSLLINAQSFLEKVLLYGGLVWLAIRSGWSWLAATAAFGGLIFALRWIDTYIPGRSAEITDLIILVMTAGLMKLLDQEFPSKLRTASP